MADREPKWIPVLTGAGIVAAWTALVALVAIVGATLGNWNTTATVLIAFAVWWWVALPVAKLVRADLKGADDGR